VKVAKDSFGKIFNLERSQTLKQIGDVTKLKPHFIILKLGRLVTNISVTNISNSSPTSFYSGVRHSDGRRTFTASSGIRVNDHRKDASHFILTFFKLFSVV